MKLKVKEADKKKKKQAKIDQILDEVADSDSDDQVQVSPHNSTLALFHPVGKRCSDLGPETQALTSNTLQLYERGEKGQNIVFLKDSKSALQALSAGPSDILTRQLLENINLLSENSNVAFQWIPAHVGIAGNEAEDKPAKEATKQIQPQAPTSYREAQTLLKNSLVSDGKNINRGYLPNHDSLHKLIKHSQQLRLRTGHLGLRKHLKKCCRDS
ncbi:uncharacterized protein LOC128549835 [Mercenaria mercenaria]|uniref:uncharacterized protein LOC128549835 n=1 Tax=Mercenaria mercenaria TaxID=6596 RepID=UPI00234E4DC5|nr:uncharacterized protein LOC128549835 [Mercenaria mercenaria]